MAILECKMCGGKIQLSEDKTFGTCENCGTPMTFPKIDDDQRATAFNRGNHFRRIGEFDKALQEYERIVQEMENDAEAHWCCALCRFGIEYVYDESTMEYLPTCHRVSFDSFLEDVDYLAAMEYSDGVTRRQYQKDAAKIAEVQRGILATSQNTEPFDVFICYKESDEVGRRTEDSILAQQIYSALTDAGRKVFYSRITLEDMAGTQYEPYIFAALNSAKVMVVVGTKPEYLNAVWVKNEWSRFLAMMKKDRSKVLLPCYRGMAPEDMPEQLAIVQGFNASDPSFWLELMRRIDKALDADKKPVGQQVIVQNAGGGNGAAMLKRGYMELKDGEWEKADQFFEDALNQDPENGKAHLGKYLVSEKAASPEQVRESNKAFIYARRASEERKTYRDTGKEQSIAKEFALPPFLEQKEILAIMPEPETYSRQYLPASIAPELRALATPGKLMARAMEYASAEDKRALESIVSGIAEDKDRLEKELNEKNAQAEAAAKAEYEGKLVRAEVRAEQMYQEALERRQRCYQELCEKQQSQDLTLLWECRDGFYRMGDYEDCPERVKQCDEVIQKLEAEKKRLAKIALDEAMRKRQEEADREAEQARIRAELRRKQEAAERRKKIIGISAALAAIAAVVIFLVVLFTSIIPGNKYAEAEAMYASGEYFSAAEQFLKTKDYKDSLDRAYACAEALEKEGSLGYAAICFGKLEDHSNAHQRSMALWDKVANRSYSDIGQRTNLVSVKTDGKLRVDIAWLSDNYDTLEIAQTPAGEVENGIAVAFRADEDIAVLKPDGTVQVICTTGISCAHKEKAEAWTGIVDIAAGEGNIVGLRKDGTVVSTSEHTQSTVKDCKNAVDVVCGESQKYMGAVLADGTVWISGATDEVTAQVKTWTDIVDLDLGAYQVVGLKSDGTVLVATAKDYWDQTTACEWTDIVEVACGDCYVLGVTKDGNVLSTKTLTQTFTNIVSIECGYTNAGNFVAVNADGTLQVSGMFDINSGLNGGALGWTDIKIPE